MKYIELMKELVNKLVSNNLADPKKIKGCTKEEIERIEKYYGFLFGRITESQMMDILVRTTINEPNSTFKKGVCFNQKISPRNFFSDIQNMANMSSLDDYWKTYKSGNSLTISSLKDKPNTANHKLDVIFTYGGKPTFPLKGFISLVTFYKSDE